MVGLGDQHLLIQSKVFFYFYSFMFMKILKLFSKCVAKCQPFICYYDHHRSFGNELKGAPRDVLGQFSATDGRGRTDDPIDNTPFK